MGKRGPKPAEEPSSGPVKITLVRPAMSKEQTQVLDAKQKYVLFAAATKVGKSVCLTQKAIETIVGGGRVVWIASTFKRSGMVFDAISKALQEVTKVSKVSINRTVMALDMDATGGSMGCYSGDTQISVDSAMGDFADLAVIDEASRCHEAALTVAQSITTATGGQICIAFNVDRSPKVSWAVRMYAEHLNSSTPDPDFLVLSMKASQSPYIEPKEVDRARKNLPARIFSALYDNLIPAEDDHTVFSHFDGCISGQLEEPQIGRRYVIGVDPARSFDYTVMCVVDTVARRVVGWERYHGVSWQMVVEKILACASKWNKALVVLDSTAQQTLLLETLQRHGIQIEPFFFTSKSKPALIEKLMTDVENHNIMFPAIPELIYEMQNYAVEIKPNGYLSYNAPKGYHDDCVTALALANYKLQSGPRFDALAFRSQYAVGQCVFGRPGELAIV